MCQRPSETLFMGFLKEHMKVISEGDAVYKIYPKEIISKNDLDLLIHYGDFSYERMNDEKKDWFLNLKKAVVEDNIKFHKPEISRRGDKVE